MTSQILAMGGSLVAVLGMAAVAHWLRLGGGYERIRDEAHAIRLADEAECGFGGIAADVDAAGYGAIVRNAAGAQLLVRAHGNRFAARRIGPGWAARLDRRFLMLRSDERQFGDVTLDLGDRAGVAASRLRNVLG